MNNQKTTYPKEFLEHVQAISNKRARIVIDHIMEHGVITTEELEKTYGYSHPPRAARDVREAGIPLNTIKATSRDGKAIAAYEFGDLTKLQTKRVAGRITSPKKFKSLLFNACAGRCHVCNGDFEERYLQVDHRVPYEVAGDLVDAKLEHFMLLCGSCNRAKSWSCEHCENWSGLKKTAVCKECYWGSPETYNHIAMQQVRRLDIQWAESEVQYYDSLKRVAENSGITLPRLVKEMIKNRTTEKLP